MPAISKIRFTNVIYENGAKRYNDDLFEFDGHNGAILLENGGGKSVFVQVAVQAVLPHSEVGDRKIRDTLMLDSSPCHIAVEWIINDKPRRYVVTAVSMYINNNRLESYKYAYEYSHDDPDAIENMPFTQGTDLVRPSGKGEVGDYYKKMCESSMNAKIFMSSSDFHEYIETNYMITSSEWKNIVRINGSEGGVEAFFDGCKTSGQLVDKLLIPVVEEAVDRDGKKNFVEVFERQRENFKMHRKLKLDIEESSKLKEKIQSYVDVFSKYDEALNMMGHKCSYARAIYDFSEEEKERIDELIEINESEFKEIEGSQVEIDRKIDSLEIAFLESQMYEAKRIYEEDSKCLSDVSDSRLLLRELLENLEISRIKKDIKIEKEKMDEKKAHIERLEKDSDVESIIAELAENSAQIKWIFEKDIYEIGKIKESLTAQISSKESSVNGKKSEIAELQKRLKSFYRDRDSNDGKMELIQMDMVRLGSRIGVSHQDEDVRSRQAKWKDKVALMERELLNSSSKISTMKSEINSLDESILKNNKEIEAKSSFAGGLEEKKKTIDKTHERLLVKVRNHGLELSYIESLYEREESVKNHIQDRKDRLKAKREELLKLERISKRMTDLYSSCEYFTADPKISEIVELLKTEFTSIESGSRYIERFCNSNGERYDKCMKKYPYWPMLVVTLKEEIELLKERISDFREELTHPLLILTHEEALKAAKGEVDMFGNVVEPSYWKENLDSSNFSEWISSLSKESQQHTDLRIGIEYDMDLLNRTDNEVEEFLTQNPYYDYSNLKAEIELMKKAICEMQIKNENDSKKKRELAAEIDAICKDSESQKDEKNELLGLIQVSQDYINMQKNLKGLSFENESIRKSIESSVEDVSAFERELEVLKGRLDGLKLEFEKTENKKDQIQREVLYKEVFESDAVETLIDMETLVDSRRNLKDFIEKKRGDIGAIGEMIEHHRERIFRLGENLENAKAKAASKIDEAFEFPVDGDDKIKDLIPKVKKIEERFALMKSKQKRSNELFIEKRSLYEDRRSSFEKSSRKLHEFDGDLKRHESDLEEQKKKLAKKKVESGDEKKRFSSQKEEIESVLKGMDIADGKYGFLKEGVESSVLEDGFIVEYPYKRKKVVKTLLSDLASGNDSVEESLKMREVEKSKFIKFCMDEIGNPKLKERNIEGVRMKESYEEIKKWKIMMDETLSKTIRISQDHIREHDKHLQQFIQHLYTFAFSISEEIRLIPKNTRIKIDGQFKDMFKFDVPKWNENQAKEEIRRHVEWMIRQLESSEFKNEDGSENQQSMRKSIQKWLDSRQVLKIVMKNDVIRIACRKVTNDKKISSMHRSWESSNKWSGGEKWSKNMALFLGVLNYSSERRHGKISGTKNSRSVIVDNPFGKASSDHVLEPVFFIAEKLGFQMIALTAHSEGNFIRNYFPVVYSCRLRETKNDGGLVVGKKKEIHHAFFRDKYPESLARIMEQKQIGMFD